MEQNNTSPAPTPDNTTPAPEPTLAPAENKEAQETQEKAEGQKQQAQPAGGTGGSQQSEEEKKKLLESIKAFFEGLKKMIKDGLAKHREYKLEKLKAKSGGIYKRLEDIQRVCEETALQSDITADAVEDLTKIVNEMNGKMNTLSPKEFNGFLDELENKVRDFTDKHFFAQTKDNDTLSRFYELYSEKMNADISKEDFNADFLAKAKVIGRQTKWDSKPDDSDKLLTGKNDRNMLMVEYKGVLYDVAFNVNSKTNQPNLIISESEADKKDVFEKSGELKPKYEYVTLKNGDSDPIHEMMTTFCRANNLLYEYDTEKFKEELNEQLGELPLYLASRMDKITLSENGEYESTFNREKNEFYIRDAKNKNTLIIKGLVGDGEKPQITLSVMEDTESINDTKIATSIGKWRTTESGKLEASYQSSNLSAKEMQRLLFNPITTETLSKAGIGKYQQEAGMTHWADAYWAKVSSKAGVAKVNQIADEMQNYLEKNKLTDKYDVVTNVNGRKDKNTFVTLIDKKTEDKLSISFANDGTPININVKASDEGRFKLSKNLVTDKLAPDTDKYRQKANFREMGVACTEVLNSLGYNQQKIVNNIKSNDSIKKAEKAHQDKNIYVSNKPEKPIEIPPEKIRNLGGSYSMQVEPEFLEELQNKAYIVNKLAVMAIDKGKFEVSSFKNVENYEGFDIKKKNDYIKSLKAMGVISGTNKAVVTKDEYEALAVDLAKSYEKRNNVEKIAIGKDNYAVFLIDAYADMPENKSRVIRQDVVQSLANRARARLDSPSYSSDNIIEANERIANSDLPPANVDELSRKYMYDDAYKANADFLNNVGSRSVADVAYEIAETHMGVVDENGVRDYLVANKFNPIYEGCEEQYISDFMQTAEKMGVIAKFPDGQYKYIDETLEPADERFNAEERVNALPAPVIEQVEDNSVKSKDTKIEKSDDDLLNKAAEALLDLKDSGYNGVSVTALQRKMNIKYFDAAELMNKLEKQGYVSEYYGSKPREIYIDRDTFEANKDTEVKDTKSHKQADRDDL